MYVFFLLDKLPCCKMMLPVFASFSPLNFPSCSSQLSKELPPRTVGRTWQLAYSTSRHGTSLKSLYRKLGATESPVLVVIKDALDEVGGRVWFCLMVLKQLTLNWHVPAGVWGLSLPLPEDQWDVLRHWRDVPLHVASSLQGALTNIDI